MVLSLCTLWQEQCFRLKGGLWSWIFDFHLFLLHLSLQVRTCLISLYLCNEIQSPATRKQKLSSSHKHVKASSLISLRKNLIVVEAKTQEWMLLQSSCRQRNRCLNKYCKLEKHKNIFYSVRLKSRVGFFRSSVLLSLWYYGVLRNVVEQLFELWKTHICHCMHHHRHSTECLKYHQSGCGILELF